MPGHDVLSRAIRQRIGDGASLGCRRLSARLAFRSTGKRVKQYPDKDRRQVLDLIEARGEPGKWLAAAIDEGFLDIAVNRSGASPENLALRALLDKETRTDGSH